MPVMILPPLVEKIMDDKRVSWGAKGLLFGVYCHPQPGTVEEGVYFKGIAQWGTESEEDILQYIEELIRYHYIKLGKNKLYNLDEKGG